MNMKRFWTLVPGLLLGSVGACGGGNVIGPANQLEVTNAADNFQWQVTALDNVTQTLTYNWQNTGTVAVVDHSPSGATSGTATLTIRSGATEVYSRSLALDGTTDTSAGTAGTWTIEVVLSGATGAYNFTVQKKP